MKEELLVATVREQIQEDIRTYMDGCFWGEDKSLDELCQIVVDNFKKMEE